VSQVCAVLSRRCRLLAVSKKQPGRHAMAVTRLLALSLNNVPVALYLAQLASSTLQWSLKPGWVLLG
jgi:hypothetical protein